MLPDNSTRLVIGASRGIGLALTRAQLALPSVSTVIATHRSGSDLTGLSELRDTHRDKLKLHSLDVTDRDSLERFSDEFAKSGARIDLTIHAAGLLHETDLHPEKSLAQCDARHLLRLFEVNSVGPLMVARALLPLQTRKRPFTFAALSAMVGSIGDNRLGGWYGYRASKAALNQFMRTLANECRISHPLATIVSLHPGTTDTDLSRPFQRNVKSDRLYSPEQTAERLLDVLGDLTPGDSGQFYNWDGSEIPW